jgi:hypothetical protein
MHLIFMIMIIHIYYIFLYKNKNQKHTKHASKSFVVFQYIQKVLHDTNHDNAFMVI